MPATLVVLYVFSTHKHTCLKQWNKKKWLKECLSQWCAAVNLLECDSEKYWSAQALPKPWANDIWSPSHTTAQHKTKPATFLFTTPIVSLKGTVCILKLREKLSCYFLFNGSVLANSSGNHQLTISNLTLTTVSKMFLYFPFIYYQITRTFTKKFLLKD